MGTQYKKLRDEHISFLEKQPLFYIASSSGGEVNLSPKGYDTIKVINSETLLFLDLPGSGNRTARDVSKNGEVTVVFNSFVEDEVNILRIFSKGELVEKGDSRFSEFASLFGIEEKYIRQFIILNIYAVETSCGDGVPIMEFKKHRSSLFDWVKKMEKSGKLEKYIEEHSTPPNLKEINEK